MNGAGSVTGRADINQVLAEMRTLRSQIQQTEPQQEVASTTSLRPSTEVSETPKFGDLFGQAVNAVNDTQMKAGQLQQAYVQGDPSVSLAEVMIQSQKSSVSFDALTQVRNRVVQAYEDIMNMPV